MMPTFNIDKRLIDILNEMGVHITYKQFIDAYSIRKSERPLKRECVCGCFSSCFRCPECNRVIGDLNDS